MQSHILIKQLLIGCSPDWEKNWKMKTKNKNKKRSECCTSLTISACTHFFFEYQNKDKTIEKQFLILKQIQSTMVYGSKVKILIYIIKCDDAALASKFYETLKNRIKNAMVAINRPESLINMINIAVKIDNRQHDRFIDKKKFKPILKNKPQFKKDLMEIDVTGKKTCYVCGKLGHLKRNCPQKQWKYQQNGLK